MLVLSKMIKLSHATLKRVRDHEIVAETGQSPANSSPLPMLSSCYIEMPIREKKLARQLMRPFFFALVAVTELVSRSVID